MQPFASASTLLLASALLAACGGSAHTPGGEATRREPPARPVAEASATVTPTPAPPSSAGAPGVSKQTLTLVAETSGRSWIHRVGPWLVRSGPGREAWSTAGRWEANDAVSALPSLDVAGTWPDHLFASLSEPFQQVREWNGKTWRPVAGLPAVDLQPWVGGTVIGRAGSSSQSLTHAFVVFGNTTAATAFVPKPAPDPKKLCPHYLEIHGFTAAPSGHLVLWGLAKGSPTEIESDLTVASGAVQVDVSENPVVVVVN